MTLEKFDFVGKRFGQLKSYTQLSRFIRKDKEEIGMAPDTLLFRGERKADKVYMRVIDFDRQSLDEADLASVKDVIKYKSRDSVSWLNLDGLHDVSVMEDIAQIFDLDQLVLAEVLNTHARPRVVEFSNCLLLSMKMLQHESNSAAIAVENLSIILTKSMLISFQEKRGDVFEPIRDRIRKQKKRIRSAGTDFLMFALLDIVIDNYIFVLSELGEKIDLLEDKLLRETNQAVIDEINIYKKELNFIRRNIKPAREMILSLGKIECEFVTERVEVHIKELQDNINLASDLSDSYREVLSDQLNIYHTTISSKLNDVMKFLTVFSVLFIPLTFIAGIYGTNFDYVPELHYKYSYFIMWGVMLVLAIGMLIYFRRKRWL